MSTKFWTIEVLPRVGANWRGNAAVPSPKVHPMPPTPLIHPEIGHPLVFGWPAGIPLPPLITDAFPVSALYPIHILQIIIGPNMDAAAEAALCLFLGTRLIPNVKCVSVVFHSASFTYERLCQVEPYVASATLTEIRILDPALQFENTTIQVNHDDQAAQSWFIVVPADDIGGQMAHDLAASPAYLNLKIIPPRSAESFLQNYDSILSRLLNTLRSTTQLQRLSLPLDFMLKDPAEAETILGLLQHHPHLEDLELQLPTVVGIYDEGSPAALNALEDTINSKSKFLTRLKRLAVPVRFIRTRLISSGGKPTQVASMDDYTD